MMSKLCTSHIKVASSAALETSVRAVREEKSYDREATLFSKAKCVVCYLIQELNAINA